jgi:hypothetical protein
VGRVGSEGLPELYDSEVVAAGRVLQRLQQTAQERRRDPEGLVREIEERFQEIGLVVSVLLKPVPVDGMLITVPDVSIVGRCEAHAFDHERMRHEVRSGLLDTPDLPSAQ